MLSSRAKIILATFFLLLTLIVAGFAIISTVQAFHSFQQQHTLVKAGDVRTIRPWMTIPYISHTYHIPEGYLYQSLSIDARYTPRRATLHTLATQTKQPVNTLVYNVQKAIIVYRRQHRPLEPSVTATLGRNASLYAAGRTGY